MVMPTVVLILTSWCDCLIFHLELGPWNAVFLTGEFIASIYMLMSIVIIFFIRSLIILGGIIKSGRYPGKMRIVIYVFASISAICKLLLLHSYHSFNLLYLFIWLYLYIVFIVILPMNLLTEGYQLLYHIMGLFLVISFHLLILLWYVYYYYYYHPFKLTVVYLVGIISLHKWIIVVIS
jgi:hypothetical protein